MRRRGKRGPNNSESTGKVGQELPQVAANQFAPLRPTYPDDAPADDSGAEIDLDSEGAGGEMHAGDEAPAAGDAVESAGADGDAQDGGKRRRRRRRRGGREVPAAGKSAQAGTAMAVSAATAKGEEADADDHSGSSDSGGDDAPGATAEADGLSLDAGDASHKLEMETQPDQLSTPPEQAPSVAARSPRGFVVLAIGLPGSGKTTWFKRRGVLPLSSDMLRSILFDDITEQRYQGLVFSTLRSLLRARLVAKMPWNYVDATNLSPHERRQWIKMAKSFGYEVQAVFFDVPVEVCLMRNQKRERRVSDEIITTMAQRLRPPNFREGFSKITVVRVKPKDGETPSALSVAPPDLDGAPDDSALEAGPEHVEGGPDDGSFGKE